MAKGRQTLRDPRSFVASASGIKKVFASATPLDLQTAGLSDGNPA
jgi:hypothetical protein